jgi:hypothetical protein
MKKTFGSIVLLGVLTSIVGCRMASKHSWYKDDFRGGFTYDEAKTCLEDYRHLMLVCITEDHVEDINPARTSSWSRLCYKGTVVKIYKGDWAVGERLALAYDLDYTAEKQSNRSVGELRFVFTDVHTNTEFGVGTGDFDRYTPEMDRLLRSLFPENKRE